MLLEAGAIVAVDFRLVSAFPGYSVLPATNHWLTPPLPLYGSQSEDKRNFKHKITRLDGNALTCYQ